MKKGKRLKRSLLLIGLSFGLLGGGGVSAEDNVSKNETFRVYIKGDQETVTTSKKQFKLQRDFGKEGYTAEVTQAEFDQLAKNDKLEVEKVAIFSIENTANLSSANIAAYPSTRVPWGMKAIYNNQALTSTSGGNGIKVAVLDTGTTRNHLDLSANTEQCKDFTTSSTFVNNSCTDRNGHGTHVSGTVAANGGSDGQGIYGVAPQAKIWAYKVLGDAGRGYSDDIAAAIRHAADQGVATGSKVIINMSLGSSGKDSLITSAVDYANSRGALVIAAAGNTGSGSNTINYPAALPNAVAIAALENVQQNSTYRVANFSSRGNPGTAGDYIIQERDIEFSSPGAAIESTWLNGNYNTISGTSMATPHAAGLAAKVWATNPSLTNAQLRAQLQTRARQYDIRGGIGAAVGDDYASGFGFARVQ